MAHQRFPQLDLHRASEELPDIPSVQSAEMVDGGLLVELEERLVFLIGSGGSEGVMGEVLSEADSVLVSVENGFLEFKAQDILFHSISREADHLLLLEQILVDETSPEELETVEARNKLADTGYLHGFVPEEIAEILVGWAVSSADDSVLDIATGSGTLLKHAEGETDQSELVGVEIHPLLAKLASTMLQNDRVDIIYADFLDWKSPGQQKLETDVETAEKEVEVSGEFDAVVGNPPAIRLNSIAPEKRKEIQEWYSGRGRSGAAVFVAKAVTHLKEGGRGAFLLPKSALKDGLLDHLRETCGIHRIVQLPVGVFPDDYMVELVVLTVVKEDRSPEVRDTGIGKFNQRELPENARGLFEQPLDGIISNRHGRYNAEIVRASHSDLEGENVVRILSNPAIYDIITSSGFTRFGDLEEAEAGSGVKTGDNEFFYFDSEEKNESGIDDRFFRPVIKNPPDDTDVITSEDIDLYLLDVQPFVEELEAQGVEITEVNILDRLEEDGFTQLVDYLAEMPERHRQKKTRFEINYRGKFEDADLVIPQMFDEPQCFKVEVDNVLFDSTVIGIRTENGQLREFLARLLNTPLYKEFFETFADSLNVGWYQINLGSLRDIPIIRDALTQDMFDRMEPFYPPKDDNDLVRLNQLLIESCNSSEEKQAVRRYLASKDDFAWSWFMTLPEFREFQELIESGDEEEAREYVLERFDQELLDQARQTFEKIGFFEDRRGLLNDLLNEFESGHYRAFLAGIVLQFEGVLADLVVEAGGDIVDAGHGKKFKMPGQEGTETKSLNNLISHFFDGEFSMFLDKTVRQRRNDIAHGDVIEDSRELSIHFFISFYALCNASLDEYIRAVQQNNFGAPA
ncbi:MAG: N-6 DNA methylase [Candidatus Aenigmatarchaeota archaeon]